MGFWDSVKDAASDVKDFVDGDDQEPKKQKAPTPTRVPEQGDFKTIIDEPNPMGKDSERPLWMTGGNAAGVGNTWNSDFMARFQKQQEEVTKNNSYDEWFDRDDATGVVLADFTTKGGMAVKAGQVFDNGKVVDLEKKYGKEGRDQLLSQLMFDSKQLQAIYKDPDIPRRLSQEVDAKIASNTEGVASALGREEFQKEVDADKGSKGVEAAGVGAAVAGGAASGAGFGALFDGVGAIPGAIVGAGAGLVSYYLNKDDANEQLARTYNVIKDARDDEGPAQAIVTGIGQVGQQALRVINPLNEAYKGALDKDRGDGQADFYERQADSPWVKTGNYVTLGIGSVSSVANLGLKAYLAGIGSATAGGLGELVTGQRFDYGTGKFENIYDSPGTAAAAIGTTMIDAIQLGTGSALGKIAEGGLKRAAGEEVKGEDIAGIAFKKNAEGEIIGHRAGITSLSPADFILGAVARRDARVAALKESGGATRTNAAGREIAGNEYTSQQLYDAASAIQNSTNVGKAALVTGFAEGAEEAVQAVLDEAQFGRTATFDNVRDSFLSGAAMGAGMGVGRNIATRGDRQLLEQYAINGFEQVTGRKPTAEEKESWKKNPSEMNYYVKADRKVAANMAKLVERANLEMQAKSPAGTAFTSRAGALAQEIVERERNKSGVRPQSSWRAQPLIAASTKERGVDGSPKFGRSDEAQEMHVDDLVRIFTDARATRVQGAKNLHAQLAKADEQIAATDGDTADMQQRRAEMADSLKLLETSEPAQEALLQFLQTSAAGYATAKNKELYLQQINEQLEAAYRLGIMPKGTAGNFDPDSVRFAATLLTYRSPGDNTSSLQAYAPRISLSAMLNDDRGATQNSPFAATGHTADYDGDNMLNDTSIILSRAAFRALRAGQFDVGVDTEDLITGVSSVYSIYAAERARTSAGDLRVTATEIVEKLTNTFANRYGLTPRERRMLHNDLGVIFFVKVTGTPIEDVMIALREHAGDKMFQHGIDNWTRESIIAPHIVAAAFDDINDAYSVRAAVESSPVVNPDEKKAGGAPTVGTKAIQQIPTRRAMAGPLTLADNLSLTGAATYLRLEQILWNYQGNSNDPTQNVDTYNEVLERNAKLMRQVAAQTVDSMIENLDEANVSDAVYALVEKMIIETGVSKNPTAAEVVTVMMQSSNIFRPEARTPDGTADTRYNTTVLQVAMQAVTAEIEAKNRQFLDQNKELRARVAKLRSLGENPDRVFEAVAEVLSGIKLYDLGISVEEIEHLPSSNGGTIGTIIKKFQQLSQTNRRIAYEEGKNSGSYSRKIGYSGDKSRELANAVARGDATIFHLVLDTAKSVADSRIEVQPDGRVTGSLAQQSSATGQNIQTVNKKILALLTQYLGGRTPTTENVMDLFDSYTRELTPVIDAILKEGGVAALSAEESGLNVREWVAQIVTVDAKQAEMILLRASIANAMQQHDVKVTAQKEDVRIAGIKDSWVRAYYELARSEPIRAREMRRLLLSETDVESWQDKTNALLDTDSVGMPILAWNRSTDTFELDKPRGGWATAPTSTQAAWLDAVSALDRFSDADSTDARMKIDAPVLGMLIEALNNPTTRANSFEYKNFSRLAETAALGLRTRIMTNGTRMQSLIELLSRPSKDGQKKGAAARALLGWAGIEMDQASLAGRSAPFLQILKFSGAVDISDVLADPSLLMTAAVIKDHDGSFIEVPDWFTVTIDGEQNVQITPNMPELLKSVSNKALYPLMMKLLLPQTSSYTASGLEQTGWMYGATLDANLGRDIQADVLANPSTFASYISHMAQMADPDDVALFESRVVTLALQEILGSDTGGTQLTVLKALRDAEKDLVWAMQNGAALIRHSRTAPDDVTARRNVLKRQRREEATAALAAGEARQGKLRSGSDSIRGNAQNAFMQRLQSLLDEYLPQIMQTASLPPELRELSQQVVDLVNAGEIEAAERLEEQNQARIAEYSRTNSDPFTALFKQMRATRDAGMLGALYAKYDVATSEDALQSLALYISTTPELRSSVSDKRDALRMIIDAVHRNELAGLDPWTELRQAYDEKDLQLLARYVIADQMRREFDPLIAAETPLHPVPKQEDKSAAFYDPSGAAMIDWVLDENDPLMVQTIKLADDMNLAPALYVDSAVSKLFKAERSALWSFSIGHTAEIIRGTFGSASVPQVIPMGGNLPKDMRAVDAITRTSSASVPTGRTQVTVTKVNGELQIDAPVLGNHTLDGMFFTNASVPGNFGHEYTVNGKLTQHPALDMKAIERGLVEGQSVVFDVIPPWARDSDADNNNAYADGVIPTTLSLDDPQMASLAAHMTYAANGINQKSQRKPLDAIKAAIAAHTQLPRKRVSLPTNEDLLSNNVMLHNFFANLADLSTEIDLGSGPLGPRFHRAAYKVATAFYVVVAKDVNGQDTYLTPQQWMKIQVEASLAGTALTDQYSDVALVPLSPKELELTYGFVGPKSLANPLAVADTANISPRLKDIADEQKRRLSQAAFGDATLLEETELAKRAWVQPRITMRAGYDGIDLPLTEVIRLEERELSNKNEVHFQRSGFRKTEWDPAEAARAQEAAILQFQDADISTSATVSSALNGPPVGTTRGEFQQPRATQEARLTLRYGGEAEFRLGQLTTAGLERELNRLGIAAGDIVFVPIDDSVMQSSSRWEQDLAKAFELLSAKGIVVQLMTSLTVPPDAKSNLIASLNGYAPVAEKPTLWAPRTSIYSQQLRRAQESLLTEIYESTTHGKLLTIVLDPGSGRVLDVNENSGYVGPDATNVHYAAHNATDIENPLVDWTSPHPSEEDDFIRYLLENTDAIRAHLANLITANGIEMSGEKMSFNDAFDDLLQRARAGTIVKKEGQYVNEGQINVDMRSHGDGKPASVLFSFEGADYPSSEADFRDQLQTKSVFDRRFAIWSNKNDPNHTTYSGRILKMFGIDATGKRKYTVLTPLQAVANKLSRVATAYKIEAKRSGPFGERLKGKASFMGRPFALITGPADAASKHLNNGDATSAQRLLEITGIDFLPTFRRALNLGVNEIGDNLLLTTLDSIARNIRADVGDVATALSAMNDDITEKLMENLGVAFAVDGKPRKLKPMVDPEVKLLTAAILYTAVEGTSILDIAQIPSAVAVEADTPGQAAVVPPELFTQVIDADDSLREYVAGVLNANSDIADSGWHIDPYDFSVYRDDVEVDGKLMQVRGTLNWGVWTARGEQAEKQTTFATDPSGTSFHNDAFFRAALGEGLATKLNQQDLQESIDNLAKAPDWDTLSYLPYKVTDGRSQKPIDLWRRLTANEVEYANEVRRILNRYFRPVNGKFSARAIELRDEAYDHADLKVSKEKFEEHFDYWLRQIRGNRGAETGTKQKDKLRPEEIELAAERIRDNLRRGMPPTYGGVVRLPIQELRWLYQHGWRVRAYTDEADPANIHNIELTQDWTSTVDSTMGWLFERSQTFWAEFTADNDAVMHGYTTETESVLDLPISRNSKIAADLLFKGYDRALSLDPNINVLLQDPAFHERVGGRPLMELGGEAVQDALREPLISDQLRASIDDHLSRWHRGAEAPVPRQQTLDETRKNGVTLPGSNAKAVAFMRPLMGLTFVMRALNLALPVGGLMEAAVRRGVWSAADLASGTAYTGFLGRLQNKLMNSHQLNPMVSALGFEPTVTTNQGRAIELWAQNEGEQASFRSALLGDINYHYERDGMNRLKALTSLEGFTARLQDLGRGIRGKKMALTYIKHYMTVIAANDGDTDTVLAMMKNPMWLIGKDNSTAIPATLRQQAHDAGIYALASLRGTAPTSASITADMFIKPFTHSTNTGTNIAGNMLLQLPLMFRQYAANLAVTLPGLQGFDMLAGIFADSRNKGLLGRFQEAVSGESLTNGDRFTDYGAVVEPNDIYDMFIRGGMTWTGLFIGASIFGGLGLSGEDEETKRRRKLAALQGAPYARDPRAVENDFRNADAIFLDWLPGIGQYFQQHPIDDPSTVVDESQEPTRAMAQPHWIAKAFLTPMVGIERWAETGDIRQVGWGFQSAMSSFPLLNSFMLHDANETFHELSNAGLQAAGSSDKEQDQLHGLTLMANAVSYYERMLLENSFVNSLYVGFDRFDRDPYVHRMRDSDGTLQRDEQLNPREGDALTYFVDDKGKTQQGYISDSKFDVELRKQTENKFTLALISSLFSNIAGNGDSYMRQDMAVKVRNYDRPTLTENQSEAALLGLFVGQEGGVKGLLRKAGGTTGTDKNSAIENQMLLSFLHEDGDEILSKHGAQAVYNGLVKGTVDLNDESLQNIYIDYPTRVAIQEEWLQRLMQEGIDLGLSHDRALYRAKAVWNGPSDGSSNGIADILWSDSIPYSKTVGYQQLNTTYITGPDGMPWATGFGRGKLMAALGLAPFQSANLDSNVGVDGRLNSADRVVGINTGQRGLNRFETSLEIPTDAEIGQSIVDAIEKANDSSYSQGFGGYGGFGGGFGGFGGGGGGGRGYATKPSNTNYFPPRWNNLNYNPITLRVPYANDAYSIRTDDVRTDLSLIRRERISSERSRLTQWQ
jgi:hypothetical protein